MKSCNVYIPLQLQLAPTDDPEAIMDMDNLKDEESRTREREGFRRAQLKNVRKNAILRQRLISIAEEAEKLGVI